jgi:hypothetical protein
VGAALSLNLTFASVPYSAFDVQCALPLMDMVVLMAPMC